MATKKKMENEELIEKAQAAEAVEEDTEITRPVLEDVPELTTEPELEPDDTAPVKEDVEPYDDDEPDLRMEDVDIAPTVSFSEQQKIEELESLKKAYASGKIKIGKDRAGRFSTSRKNTYHNIEGGSSTFTDPEAARRRSVELQLFHSLAGREILTGKSFGIKRIYDEKTPGKVKIVTCFDLDPFVVVIPIEEYTEVNMEELNARQHENGNVNITLAETQARYLNNRIHSDVDYIITKIPRDENGNAASIVYGSRIEAMKKKRIHYWYGRYTDNEYFIKEGDKCEARIIMVSKRGIRVEIYGVESFIDYHELSWSMIHDCTKEFEVGKTIAVRILSITRGSEEDGYPVSYTASVKQAVQDPRDRGLTMFQPTGEYRGKIAFITNSDENRAPKIFVKLAEGVQCLCDWPAGPTIPVEGCEVRVFITHHNQAKKQMYGRIMYVAPYKDAM